MPSSPFFPSLASTDAVTPQTLISPKLCLLMKFSQKLERVLTFYLKNKVISLLKQIKTHIGETCLMHSCRVHIVDECENLSKTCLIIKKFFLGIFWRFSIFPRANSKFLEAHNYHCTSSKDFIWVHKVEIVAELPK